MSKSGECTESLQYYDEILSRFRQHSAHRTTAHAEATVLYKMSKVHRQLRDWESEQTKLEQALRLARSIDNSDDRRSLEKVLLDAMHQAQKDLQRQQVD